MLWNAIFAAVGVGSALWSATLAATIAGALVWIVLIEVSRASCSAT
jgi:hypothetical protein